MSTVHTSAASLYRAILDAASTAWEDSEAVTLDAVRPGDPDEDASNYCTAEFRGPWLDVKRAMLLEVPMHGPVRPYPAPATFAFQSNGARASFKIKGNRTRLLAMAEQVRKHWALYGGGPVPADLAKPKAAKRAVTWPASIVKVWLQQFEDKDYAGAMLTGERLDAVFYPGAKGCAFILAAPIQVEGLPEGVCSARRNDGKWVVACMQSGRAIESRGYGSRKTAEESALSEVARVGLDKLTAALERNRADAVDHDEARAAWCKACNIEDPREPAPVAQPAPESEEGAESADEWAARMVAQVAQPKAQPEPEPAPPEDVAQADEVAQEPAPMAQPVADATPPDTDEVARIAALWADKPGASAELRARAANMRHVVIQGLQWPGAVQDAAADLSMARARVYDAAAEAIDAARPGPAAPLAAPATPVVQAAPPVGVSAPPVMETPVHPLAASAAKLASLRQELAETSPDLPQTIGFLRHVIGTHQGLHDKLAAAFAVFDSVGIGAELANTDGRRFCVILPDASAPGAYRWQGFDKSGFFTHSTHKTAALAVADVADQGYTVAAPGSLDRLAGAPEWARGMAISEVMQAHNAGLMPWAAACDRMRDIHAEHDALAAAAPAGPDLEPAPHVAEPAPPVAVSAGHDAATMRKAADRAQVLADGIKAAAGDDPATMARMLKSEAARVKAAALGMPARIAASYRATADMLEYAAELHADAAARKVPDMALKPQPGTRVQATARRPVMARRSPLAQPWRTGPATARQGRAAPRMRPQAAAPPVWVCAAPVGESGQRFN